MSDHPHHAALRAAVTRAGDNQSRFAREIGTSQQLVSYWLTKGRPLPGEYVLAAERAGFGSRYELRPDLYPVEEEGAALPDAVALCGRCETRADDPHVDTCTSAHCPMRVREAEAA